MIPLFNNITCVRLGNCSLQLDACDLETVHDRSIPNTRNWFAWNDIQPPPPDSFHLVGEVEVVGPLSDVLLVERSPQGINHTHPVIGPGDQRTDRQSFATPDFQAS